MMEFYGTILMIGWFLIIIGFLFFIAATIVFIINLVLCIKNKWQKKNLIPMIISGAILTYFLFSFAHTLIEYAITPKVSNGDTESALILYFTSLL